MEKKGSPLKMILRLATALSFLALFVFLVVTGRPQIWLGVFIAGAVVSVFYGRFYCSRVCPMNTLFRPIALLYKKLGIKRRPGSGKKPNPVLRYGVLALFLVAMVVVRRFAPDFPMLAFIVGLAVLITLFFEESLWHTQLCPYGTILNFTARFSRYGMVMESGACRGSPACRKSCPAGVIRPVGEDGCAIENADCLLCGACVRNCAPGSVKYAKLS